MADESASTETAPAGFSEEAVYEVFGGGARAAAPGAGASLFAKLPAANSGSAVYTSLANDVNALLQRIDKKLTAENAAMDRLLRRLSAAT